MNHSRQANKYRILLVIILSLMHPKASQNISDNSILYKDTDDLESARLEGIGVKDSRQQEDTFEIRPNDKNTPHSAQIIDSATQFTHQSHPTQSQKNQIVEAQKTPISAQHQNTTEEIIEKEEQASHKQNKQIEQKVIQTNITLQNQSKNTDQLIKLPLIESPLPDSTEKSQSQQKIPNSELQALLEYCKQQITKVSLYLYQFFLKTVLTELNQYLEKLVIKIVDHFPRKLAPFIRSYYQLYKIMIDETKPRPKKVYYENNYANLYGGAKIIMKSSPKIKSINSILEDGSDKYMYTDEKLPIKIIIGLNQEIAIDSIIIQSYEMYSCITKDFMVEGKFTMDDKKWVYLGRFRAENTFGDQQFYTDRKIVRYIKVTFLSAYGKWSYLTLTQIKIRGKGLFADALTELTDKKNPGPDESEIKSHHQSESHKQDGEDRPPNTCLNQFKPISNEPFENNLITSLITKIDNLELKNTVQSKQLQFLTSKLGEVTTLLLNKTLENQKSMEVLNQYKMESDRAYYVILISLSMSGLTLCCLTCICLMRRKELTEIKTKRLEVKKSNSLQ